MDENIVYFQNILPQLRGIYLHEVWENILRMIARRIHSTSLYPSDWKDFASEIGIKNALVLEDIEISASINKELPLCAAFCGPLQYSYTLYDIIQALINLQRADVLCLIREEFEDFWNEQSEKMFQRSARASSHGNCAAACSALTVDLPKGNMPLTDEDTSSRYLSSRSEAETTNCESLETNKTTGLDYSRSEEHRDDKLIAKAESEECSTTEGSSHFEILDALDCDTKLKDVHFIHCKPLKKNHPSNSHPLLKVNIPEVKDPSCPSAELIDNKNESKAAEFLNEPISVFIIYVACEIRTGIQLANRLRQKGLRVVTISEAEWMIGIDRSGFLLKRLLEKVDFVIPIICKDYMLCVRPDRIHKLNSNDRKTNRFIFTWIHSEYENNLCFNFRVKPVVVEKFDWHLIGNDPIFNFVHQLWTEVDDLVKILHDTKQMMNDFVELWNREEFVQQWMNFLNPD